MEGFVGNQMNVGTVLQKVVADGLNSIVLAHQDGNIFFLHSHLQQYINFVDDTC